MGASRVSWKACLSQGNFLYLKLLKHPTSRATCLDLHDRILTISDRQKEEREPSIYKESIDGSKSKVHAPLYVHEATIKESLHARSLEFYPIW